MPDSDESVPDQSEQLDLDSDEMLVSTGRDDLLDGGYEVADHWSAAQGFGNTPQEQAAGETLDQRLAQEEPDVGDEAGPSEGATPVDPDVTELNLVGQDDLDKVVDDEHASVEGGTIEGLSAGDLDDFQADLDEEATGELFAGTENLDDGEVGDEQVVRLVEPNEGVGEDTESDLVALDADDSSEQSAEEAAVHVVPGS